MKNSPGYWQRLCPSLQKLMCHAKITCWPSAAILHQAFLREALVLESLSPERKNLDFFAPHKKCIHQEQSRRFEPQILRKTPNAYVGQSPRFSAGSSLASCALGLSMWPVNGSSARIEVIVSRRQGSSSTPLEVPKPRGLWSGSVSSTSFAASRHIGMICSECNQLFPCSQSYLLPAKRSVVRRAAGFIPAFLPACWMLYSGFLNTYSV